MSAWPWVREFFNASTAHLTLPERLTFLHNPHCDPHSHGSRTYPVLLTCRTLSHVPPIPLVERAVGDAVCALLDTPHVGIPAHAIYVEIDDARMFTHRFERILVGQSVCTVVGIVLQPCNAIDGKDRGTPGSPLLQEIRIMQKAFAYPFMYWVGMNTPSDTDPAAVAEFSQFYSTIHVPEVVASNPGFVRGTRYELL